MRIQTLCNLAFYAVKSSPTYKKNVSCVYMNIFLVGMFASSLWRYVNNRTFQKFQKSLLNTFSTHITRNAGIVLFARNFIDFINKHDAALRLLDVIVCNLKQATKNAFNILTHITGLCKNRSIHNGEWHFD